MRRFLGTSFGPALEKVCSPDCKKFMTVGMAIAKRMSMRVAAVIFAWRNLPKIKIPPTTTKIPIMKKRGIFADVVRRFCMLGMSVGVVSWVMSFVSGYALS